MNKLFFDSEPQITSIHKRLPENPHPALVPVISSFEANHYRWQAVEQMLWDVAICVLEYGGKRLPPPDWSNVFNPPELTIAGWDKNIQVMFESQILHAWTMFETLTGDLWLAAVNSFPDPLAGLQGKESRIADQAKNYDSAKDAKEDIHEEDTDADDFIAINSSKTIGISHLHNLTRGGFDLSHRMGDLMVMAKRVKFDSLSGVRSAYSLAFSEKHKINPLHIDNALASVSLDALAITRNAIVHCGGIADDEYHDKQIIFTLAPATEIGKPIELNCGNVRSLIEPVVNCSIELIVAIEKWINRKNCKKRTSPI